MIAAVILVPIIIFVLKKPPTPSVSHRPTSKPGKILLKTNEFFLLFALLIVSKRKNNEYISFFLFYHILSF